MIYPTDNKSIPPVYKTGRGIKCKGYTVAIIPHARLRFWQRHKQKLSDQEIARIAKTALDRGDDRFIFEAEISQNNPYKPTVIRLITVLSNSMKRGPFKVKIRYSYDWKWDNYLTKQTA